MIKLRHSLGMSCVLDRAWVVSFRLHFSLCLFTKDLCWLLTTYTNLSYLSTLQVNNAGIVGKGTIENTSLEDFDKVMNINVRLVLFPFTCQVSKLCIALCGMVLKFIALFFCNLLLQ